MEFSFHLCGGKARRSFTINNRYEYWVWCSTCGDWYLGMVIKL